MSVLEWDVKVFTQFVPSVISFGSWGLSWNLKGKVKAEIVGLQVEQLLIAFCVRLPGRK